MASPSPRRPDALAAWGRAAIPADLASPGRARREQFVGAIVRAMERPAPRARASWLPSMPSEMPRLHLAFASRVTRRRLAATVAAAALLLVLVGTGFAQTAGGAVIAGITSLLGAGPAESPGAGAPGPAALPAGAPPSRAPTPRGPTQLHPAGRVETAVEGRAYHGPTPGKVHRGATPAADDPELAMQNRVFADAMNARARGDLGGAVRLLDDFLVRYPASVLAEDAHVERFRALAGMGDHRGAARAARAYLAAYGGGFARDEARRLAALDR